MADLAESDRLVLEQLAEHGDAGEITRPVFIWIYGEEADLAVVSQRLRANWGDVDPEKTADRWVIRAQRDQSATDDAISKMVAEITDAIGVTSAEFDGWESSVERAN